MDHAEKKRLIVLFRCTVIFWTSKNSSDAYLRQWFLEQYPYDQPIAEDTQRTDRRYNESVTYVVQFVYLTGGGWDLLRHMDLQVTGRVA